MRLQVTVSEYAAVKAAQQFGDERSLHGGGSELDFWSGPLDAARLGFLGFNDLPFDHHRDIRRLHVVDRVFGAVVFIGVLIEPDRVEIADFDIDPDYWTAIAQDPTS